jgi:hypothetical protein
MWTAAWCGVALHAMNCLSITCISTSDTCNCMSPNNYIWSYFMSNYMEQNPSSDANSRSASQEISHLLWNPKVHCHVHKSTPTLRSSKWSFPFRSFDQNCVWNSHIAHTCYVPCPSHPLFFHLPLMPRSKNARSYTSTLPIRLHGMVFSLKKKAQRQLYL